MVENPDAPAVPDAPDAAPQVAVGAVAQVRRAPRYRAFGLAGALAGVVVALVATLVVAGVTGRDAVLGYAALFTGLGAAALGALVGMVVAVLLDRRS